jgi:type III pantothenate kinase
VNAASAVGDAPIVSCIGTVRFGKLGRKQPARALPEVALSLTERMGQMLDGLWRSVSAFFVVARGADYLLIDISNSYAKFAFASKRRLSAPGRIATRKLSSSVIAGLIRQREVRKVVVSSVVPKKNSAISNATKKTAEVLWLDWKLNLGVAIDYPKPQSIGADRLANAAAVADLYGFPAVVVDFGTAVTFDIVSERRAYVGGVIAPGLEAMTSFLYKRTALLPRISLKEPRQAVGTSTIKAMLSGAVFGYRGLVKEILARIKAEQFPRKKAYVIATGGYARLIAGGLPEIGVIRPHLTLEGLRIVANLND